MSPFDEARYARLLKGLEISETLISDVLASNAAFRIDAERFSPRVIRMLRRLGRDGLQLADVASTNCRRFIPAVSGEFDYIEIGGVTSSAAINAERLPQSEAPSRASQIVEANDVITSKVRPIRRITALISSKQDGFVCSSGFAVLKPRHVSPELLFSYLRAQQICELMDLHTTASMYPAISEQDLLRLPFLRFSKQIENCVVEIVQRAHQLRELSAELLTHAERSLLRALKIDSWKAPVSLTYLRNSRDAFNAERFDAEYFHPAKTEALARLNALSDCTVGDLFNSVRELWQPADDSGPDVVRNYDLTDALSPFLDGSKEPSDRASIASTKKVIRTGDLVVSRLRSYLKEIALVQPGGKIPMVASTEFIVLRPRQAGGLPPEALMIFLRSVLPQTIFKWSQDGSNHPRFDEKELLRLPVPRVLLLQASEYVTTVRSVISKREQAIRLLDAAKRAVEIAIDQDENSALAYLEAQT